VRTVGLFAGWGGLPRYVAEDAKKRGFRVVAIALEPVASADEILPYADVLEKINVGKVGKILNALKRNGVKEAVMAGKVPKSLLYHKKVIPDWKAAKILFSLKNRNDDTIMLALTEELGKEGIKLLPTTEFCKDLLASEGVYTKKSPSKQEWADIEYGFNLAKEIGRLDIGQTVIVKHKAVMAIEAIEGTDRAIKRGGKLAGDGAVVVKVAKPAQDMRFDVPAVGLMTIEAMLESSARVLALEAGKTLFLEKEKCLKEANQAGITILGYKGK
jgi:DUF1009 family protein